LRPASFAEFALSGRQICILIEIVAPRQPALLTWAVSWAAQESDAVATHVGAVHSIARCLLPRALRSPQTPQNDGSGKEDVESANAIGLGT